MNEHKVLQHLLDSDANGKLDYSEESEVSLSILKRIKQKFHPLKVAEEKLFAHLDSGELDRIDEDKIEIDYSEHCENTDSCKKLNDPAGANNWGDKRTLRAKLLACVCRDPQIQEQLPPQGLTIKGAKIDGELNLDFAEINVPLCFVKCALTKSFRLQQAKLCKLNLEGTHVASIIADQVNIAGCLELNRGFSAAGKVSLLGAKIGGTLNCKNGRFSNEFNALIADGINVEGSIFLSREKDSAGERFFAKGQVSLIGATIGRSLICTDGHFVNPKGKEALLAFLREWYYKIQNNQPLKTEVLDLWFVGLVHNLISGRANLQAGNALIADGINVGGCVFLKKTYAVGKVSLLGANIEETLDCSDGKFENPKDIALSALRINVKGDVFLRYGFRADGEVNLNRAIIEGVLDLRKSEKINLNLESARVQNLKIGEKNNWADQGKLQLNGLVYNSIIVEKNSSDQQSNEESNWFKTIFQKTPPLELNWIRKQPHKPFLPQPYEQLATVLKSHGKEGEAIQVLIGKEDDRRKYDGLNRLGKCWNWFLGVSIGHGYRPGRAGVAALGLLAIGGGFFWWGDSQNLMSPATDSFISKTSISEVCQPESSYQRKEIDAYPSNQYKEMDGCPNYPKFNPLFYSLDVLLPVVDLHMESYWIPNTSWLRYYLWFQILMGWILTSLIVAAFSGLVRSSN